MTFVPVANRGLIMASIMVAAFITNLDSTIANIALPQIQGSLSAASEEITWVLTSYIIAVAIMTPMSGWLAGRFGRKRVLLVSIAGFTLMSAACGLATDLPQMVLFRTLQGMFGASLAPISQSLVFDMNPPEKHGQAMATWGSAILVSPMLGPVIGGFITEHLSWRWVFLINLPLGILAFAGVWLFMRGMRDPPRRRFDFVGYGALAAAIASLQLILDRGPGRDWFNSLEIWVIAAAGVISTWVFVTHTLTTAHPFFSPALARQRNFITCAFFAFFCNMMMFSTLTLLPPLTQNLMGYPVLLGGLVTMPRGLTSCVTMFIVGQFIARYDVRRFLMLGLALCAFAFWDMSQYSLEMGWESFALAAAIQGLALGMVNTPLSTIGLGTTPMAIRGEATAIYHLVRNLGASVGIAVMHSMVITNTAASYASIGGQVDPSTPAMAAALGSTYNPAAVEGLIRLSEQVHREAAMVAYVNVFRLMMCIALICIPFLLFLRGRDHMGREETLSPAKPDGEGL